MVGRHATVGPRPISTPPSTRTPIRWHQGPTLVELVDEIERVLQDGRLTPTARALTPVLMRLSGAHEATEEERQDRRQYDATWAFVQSFRERRIGV